MALTWNIPDAPEESNGIPLPAGIILFFDDTIANIPAGWSEFTDANDEYLYGVGTGDYDYKDDLLGASTVPNKVALSSIDQKFVVETSSSGVHSHSVSEQVSFTSPGALIPGRVSNVVSDDDGGAHTHFTSYAYHTPDTAKLVLIKANSETSNVPNNACFLATSDLSASGSALAHDGRYISSIASGDSGSSTAAADTPIVNSGDGGAHGHGSATNYYNGIATYNVPPTALFHYPIPQTTPPDYHNHTDTALVVEVSIKKAVARLYKKASEGQISKTSSDVIGLWESDTPPAGWSICDGTNGTPDLRDCFIEASNTGDGSVTGDHSCSISGDVDSHTFSHDHYRTTAPNIQKYNPAFYSHTNYWDTTTIPHQHNSDGSGDFFLPGFTMYFIKYTG